MTLQANATVGVFEDLSDAALRIRRLSALGFDLGRVSVAGRDLGQPGTPEAFPEDLRKQLSGWALFSVPGIGPVVVAGPLADWAVVSLENLEIFGDLGPIGGALYSMGIPRDVVAVYEAALGEGRYLVIAHGAAGEVARADEVLRNGRC